MSGNLTRTFADVQEAQARQNAVVITATVDGVGSEIPADADFVTITAGTISHWVVLPAAVNGKVLKLFVVATGCEVRSSVAADKLNNVVIGATNEGLLVAAIEYTLTYNGTTGNWVCTGRTATGSVQALVVPDAV